jgi:TRAP-type C4-dicarboxylate transport system permease large subunit
MKDITILLLGVMACGAIAAGWSKNSECMGAALVLDLFIGLVYIMTHH